MNEFYADIHIFMANELIQCLLFIFRAKMKGFSPWPGRVSVFVNFSSFCLNIADVF